MSEQISIINDMSNPHVKRQMIAQVGALQGLWRVELRRYCPRRSDRQNRYYHPCFVAPFAEYLIEQGNNHFRDPHDAAHEILKAEFLRSFVVDKDTGRRRPYVRSTTELNTIEFNDYLDKCAAMLAQECRIVVPDPSIYHERDTISGAAKTAPVGSTPD